MEGNTSNWPFLWINIHYEQVVKNVFQNIRIATRIEMMCCG